MINAAGAALLTKSEGIKLKAYFCPAGIPTIGRGHTRGITAQMVRDGYTITPEQERTMFVEDMIEWERDVRACLKRKPNDNQLAAFICLAYNIGITGFAKSTVVREYERGNDTAAAQAFGMWDKATVNGEKVVMRGLVTRRAEESALFLTPATGVDPVPQAVETPQPTPTGAPTMAPFLFAAIPALLEAVPKLVSIFGSGSETSQRNVKAVEAVVEIAKAATGAVNEQDLTEKLKDPVAVEQLKTAIEANWFNLTEVGGGVQAARKADAVAAPAHKSPAFAVTLLLMPIIYAAVYAVLFTDGFSDDMKAMALGAIFGGLMTGALSSYWFGTSASSARKTELQKQ